MEPYHAWVNTALVLAGLAFSVWLANRKKAAADIREIAELTVKVDTMWDAFLASGVVKGISKGKIQMNSPVRLAGNSAEIMEGLKIELQAFRKNECPDCNEKELALKIATKFKEPIMQICTPNDLQFEVGLLIATAVAKGGDTLTGILDEYLPSKH